MVSTALRRIVKSGFQSFRRNGWLSTATITVMVMALFVLGNLVFLSAFANSVLLSLESKIDVSVFFLPDAQEEDILKIRDELESQPNVLGVSYVSKERALELFRERHTGNALILDALDELGENPLEASLNVRARNPSDYASISSFLDQKKYSIVDKINYFENQRVIERLSAILGGTRVFGTVLASVLAFVAVLVAFNTVRLAIYTLREEIGIMRLVGGSSWFIRGPFLVTGVLYGIAAAAFTVFLFFPVAWLASPRLAFLVPEFNLFEYFLAHFFEFAAIMFVVGISLGAISSAIAIRRYLRV